MIQTKMMKKQKYEAPSLTVVEFMSERGFAFSGIKDVQALNEQLNSEIIYDNQYIAAGFSNGSVSGWTTNGWGDDGQWF